MRSQSLLSTILAGLLSVLSTGAIAQSSCPLTADIVRTIDVPGLRWGVRSAGDFNGDSYPDIVAGGANQAFVYWGGPDSVDAPPFELLPGVPTVAFGFSACGTDFNNDGYADIVVGDSEVGPPNGPGKAFVFFGGFPPDPDADLTLTPDAGQRLFGWFAAPAGDVNNDSYDDVIVTSIETSTNSTGHVYVYFGGASPDATADWILSGPEQYGYQASGAGDVNGDGYDDFVVGARNWWHNGNLSGIAFIYFGAADFGSVVEYGLVDTTPYDHFGASVGSAGDFNGDGLADVVVGTTQEDGPGYANLYLGSASPVLDFQFVGEAGVNSTFGEAVGTVGPVNADVFDDVIVSDYTVDGNRGAVYVYLGGPAADTEADLVIEGPDPGGYFGIWLVGSIDDFTGNGVREILIGAPGVEKIYLYEVPVPETITWTGEGDATSWDDSANWDLDRVPGTDDLVVIPNVGPTTEVVYASGSTCVYSVTCSEPFVLQDGDLSIGSNSTFSNSFTLETPATLSGLGDVTVEGTFNWSGGTLSGAASTLANGGLFISGTDTKDLRRGRVLSNASAGAWSGSGAIRHGEGELGTQFDNLVGATFQIQGDATLEHISGAGDPALFNNLGTLSKTAPGSGLTTIETDLVSAGVIDVESGTLSLAGDFANYSNQTLLGGTITVADTLKFVGANVVTNSATLHLVGPAGAIVNESGGWALSSFSANTGQFTTDGVDLTTPAFTNSGTVSIGPTTTWTVGGLYRQTAGRTTVQSETSLLSAGSVNVVAGDIRGNGELGGPGATFTNSGVLLPGGSPGLIDISGVYIQSPDGIYVCELGGQDPGPGGYDQVRVSGSATLDGLLELQLVDGFVPAAGDTFAVLTGGTVVDSFATIDVYGLVVRQENSAGLSRIIVEESNYREFVGQDGGSWFSASNWNPAGVPSASSDLLVDREVRVPSAGAEADEIRLVATTTLAPPEPPDELLSERTIGTGWLRLSGGTLTVRELGMEPDSKLSLEGASALLRPQSLTIPDGANFLWQGGTIELDGGTMLDENPYRFVGTSATLSRWGLLGGASAFASGATTLAANGGTQAELVLQGGARIDTGTLAVGVAGTAIVRLEGGTTLATGWEGYPAVTTIGPAGTLAGSGLVLSSVASDGTLDPGNATAPGTLRIDGTYSQSFAGVLGIDLGGTSPGQFDVVAVNGDVMLGGRLEVRFLHGFQAALGDSFRVMTFASRQGTFATVEGAPVDVLYEDGAITLVSTDEGAGAGDSGAVPLVFSLDQNSPNPFHFETSLRYSIASPANVSLVLYSVNGRIVRTLVDHARLDPGRYSTTWDGRDDRGHLVASGIYFYSLEAPPLEARRRLVFLR